MADKDTEFNITIGAEADVNSAKKAAKDIAKAVDSSVKGGRIEVPVDITIPIDETKSKLTKAQKDVTTKLSKMMSKGFSASGKDIDDLISKFNEFTKAFDQSGKGRQNKTFREIRKQVEELQKSYRSLQKSEKGYSQDAINKASAKWTKEMRDREAKKARLSGIKQVGPKGFKRNTGFDTGVATKKTILDTERGGSYESNWAKQIAKSTARAVSEDAKTLKVRKVSVEEANRMAEEALARGGNKHRLTSTEKAQGMASALLPELAKILGDIEHGEKAASADQFFNKLEAILKLNQDAGMKAIDNAMSVINMTFHKWFNTDGTLGASDGTNKIAATRKDSIEQILKELMKRLDGLKDGVVEETKAVKEETMERKKTTSARNKTKRSVVDQLATESETAKKSLHSALEGLVPVSGTYKSHYEGKDLYNEQKMQRILEKDSKRIALSRSTVTTSLKNPAKLFTRFRDNLMGLVGATATYRKVLDTTSKEQDALAAKRIKEYGMDRGRNVTGDKILFARSMSLWRGRDKFSELFKDLKISDGVKIDTTQVTDKLGKILTGRQMRNAQMGGSPLRNLIGYGTGFIGMPSLEKSRAAADALNQINADIREAMNTTLADIQDKESALQGMADSGDLKLGANGEVLESSTVEAKTLAAQLENSKLILDSILADMGTVDKTIGKFHGNINKVVQNLNFASPILRKENAIVHNINAGYDKGGKALRFQTRTAEILNYTFQLMGRQVGKMIKQWANMLNPINIIKKAFGVFSSYNVKWQRTMNVIKYNVHAILEPFMDKVAQFLVNCIGFVDIISMKVQEAFGNVPISLFDQAAADSQKIKEELEAAANVSAGFDELHDIGSDNSGANDLLGEIYKPQLSEDWINLANEIGDLFAGLITGDLGFKEVMQRIIQILWDGLKTIATTIWDWFKQTSLGKYLTTHWADILGTILDIFIKWQLLKIAGKLLFNALFGGFTEGSVGGILGKVGTWLSSGLGVLFSKGGIVGAIQSGGASLGSIFAASFLAVLAIALGGIGLYNAIEGGKSVGAYNAGIASVGGDKKDNKSNLGNVALGTISGAAIGAGIGSFIPVIGTGIGAAIGAVVGLITSSLAPAFEELEIAARNANNEMQKIEYYEGQVQGAQSQVDVLNELMDVLNQTLKEQTNKVYEQGTKLGISKTRMDELVKSTQDGTFETGMLTGAEIALSDSLTELMTTQGKVDEATKRLTEAKKKLLKAETDLAIAQDAEAGNYELAAARIELAEAQEVYTTEEATKKRIQLFKTAGEEEKKNLLQNFSDDQRTRMAELNDVTDSELQSLIKIWQESGEDIKEAFLSGTDASVQAQFQRQMNDIDAVVKSHQNFWQGVGDTIAEIFTLGNAKTWTYNGKEKYAMEYQNGKYKIQTYAVGTNYVPSDGLAYLHQGEAVIPKKYNQPYSGELSGEERAYMQQLMVTMRSLDNTMKQGLHVNGEFRQRGSDLVAVVNKTKSQTGSDLLSNVAYAR